MGLLEQMRGKTTTLKMISGLARPTDGEIIMFGYRGRRIKEYPIAGELSDRGAGSVWKSVCV